MKQDVVADEAQFIAEEVQAYVLDVADLVGVVQSRYPELSQIWLYLKARIWSSLKTLYLVIERVACVAYVAYVIDEDVAEVVGVDNDQSRTPELARIWLSLKARTWSYSKTLYLVIAKSLHNVACVAYVIDEEVAGVEGVDDDKSGFLDEDMGEVHEAIIDEVDSRDVFDDNQSRFPELIRTWSYLSSILDLGCNNCIQGNFGG